MKTINQNKQAYVVLSVRDLQSMIRQIEEKNGVQIDPASGENIMCGVFMAPIVADSKGELQIKSYEFKKLAFT